jgi:transcriptional regulator with XRE-family HTH domain
VSAGDRNLGSRIRELRRRHFGKAGVATMAERLGIAPPELEKFERGQIPSGELLVRICEVTGEDLQWLLTGVAARGTVVISNTRARHQALLSRLARVIDERPQVAASIEALLDLLTARPAQPTEAPLPKLEGGSDLIPLLNPGELPASLDADANGFAITVRDPRPSRFETPLPALVIDPSNTAEDAPSGEVEWLRSAECDAPREYLRSPRLAAAFEGLFGVCIESDDMRPMLEPGDAVLAAAGAPPRVGRLALVRTRDGTSRVRMWLGPSESGVSLGRLGDHECETLAASDVCWSLEVLFRVTRAA